MTQIGLTAIPNNMALKINTIGDGMKIMSAKLVNANINPHVNITVGPNRFRRKPMTKFVNASLIKCKEIAKEVIPTVTLAVVVGRIGK